MSEGNNMSQFYELPAHKCGLSIEHNEHRNYYEIAAQFIEDRQLADCFESPAEMAKAIETDSIWVLQWYPDTPIGFYRVAASTLYDLLRYANSIDVTRSE